MLCAYPGSPRVDLERVVRSAQDAGASFADARAEETRIAAWQDGGARVVVLENQHAQAFQDLPTQLGCQVHLRRVHLTPDDQAQLAP